MGNMGETEAKPGHEEAYDRYDYLWYFALDRLETILRTGVPVEQVEAAKVVLDYSKHFTILGAPYVPESDPPENFDE